MIPWNCALWDKWEKWDSGIEAYRWQNFIFGGKIDLIFLMGTMAKVEISKSSYTGICVGK